MEPHCKFVRETKTQSIQEQLDMTKINLEEKSMLHLSQATRCADSMTNGCH